MIEKGNDVTIFLWYLLQILISNTCKIGSIDLQQGEKIEDTKISFRD